MIPKHIRTLVQTKVLRRDLAYTLTLIHTLEQLDGECCWASNLHLAKECGVHRRSIIRDINKLEALGLIKTVNKVFRRGRWHRAIINIRANENDVEIRVTRMSLDGVTRMSHNINTKKEIYTSPASQGSKNKEQSMGWDFMPEVIQNDKHSHKVKVKDKHPAKFDVECASQFLRIIKSITPENKLTFNHSPKKWCKDFRILRDKRSPGEVATVLDWLEQVAPKAKENKLFAIPYTPKFFREWFDELLERCQKDQKSEVEVSQEAMILFDQLKHYRWPKGSKDLLPQAIQITYDNFRKIKAKLFRLASESKGRISEIAGHMAQVLDHGHYTKDWFRLLFNRIHDWQAWHGDIIREAFDGNLNDKRFKPEMIQVIANYASGNNHSELWNQIVKEISE